MFLRGRELPIHTTLARRQGLCGACVNDMDVGGVLAAVNAEVGGRWQVERRLAGGWNEGAYCCAATVGRGRC